MELAERFGLDRVSPERAWVYAAVAALFALVAGSLVFGDLVYDRFIWQYFWGPVVADANNAQCAVLTGGNVDLVYDAATCSSAEAEGRIVAEPGYTLVSEVGYAATLVFMLTGVLFLVRALDVVREPAAFFALVPYMFFGGALRVVEDANDAAVVASGVDQLVAYPLNTLLISPVIYFTVFALTLASLLAGVALERAGVVERYESPLFALGCVYLLATFGYLYWVVVGRLEPVLSNAGFYPQMLLLTVALSLVIAGTIYVAAERLVPAVTAGTGLMTLVVLFAHSLDGVANVLATDWASELGLPFQYSPKHPVNEFIIEYSSVVLPENVVTAIGSAWPFLLVKVVAAVLVVYIFDEAIFEESPRYAIVLLVAIVAVGLGPGTRDMLRATFGI
ncbi:DUF63 family protein [Halomarina ordinaria]|uniref:DUF63 family protein n=1 Tax=Halomarina ordinaria TaxID=3033939 RepID=A0ABD5U957_9EURY|nr:DUF63 family protein [Halomarina sp. PSRA2]